MEHPGPPRFVAVGDVVELAPRDPDPDATYRWSITEAPIASDARLGDDAVPEFVPDVPGRYVVTLETPTDEYDRSIRVFPGERRPTGRAAAAGIRGASGYSGMSGYSGYSGASGSARPSGSGRSGFASGSGSGVRDQTAGGADGRPRVRLDAAVEGDEVVVRATPTPHPDSDRPADDLGVEFLLDDRDDVDRGSVTVTGRELRVPLAAIDDRLRVHGVAVGASYSVADAVGVERLGDAGNVAVERLNDPPAWATDSTLYEIYVRGFAADDETAETTFEALENRLEYVDELGVDTLWLTPVLQHDGAPHGYNITDFFSIADDLGDREDYERFVEAAHDRGMRVLFDFVANHSARDHPWFEDAYQNPDSPYRDRYEWQTNGEPGTYFDWELIANFDFSSLDVRRHLLDAADTWADLADGFRCDMAWAVPESFWRELRDRLKSRDPEFLLLDETIPYIADFHEGMFDVHFDTTLYFTLRQVGNGHEPAAAILDAVEGRARSGFPDHAAFMLYAENHDETRYIVECGDAAAKAAAGALFTLPGLPMLYGGQELGQRGNRDPLAWDHAREEIRAHYDDLLALQDAHPGLHGDGGIERLAYETHATDDVVAFIRETDERRYVVLLNFGPEPATVGIDESVDATDLVSGESRAVAGGLTVDDVAVFEATS
jgi:glycosidase